ncbi:MAG: cytochrome c oxidase subunit I [Mesorhizobium sp.]|jgi:cytochrome c oxidase subunit I|uniref:cytochrome c oxidase subunit I n=2 Tax=Mesorhizobium TaxID=68287 RepID=UPI000FCB358F|nr:MULTISPECIES: cytochrome c oxidase subunit I [unclassified Mesorhizobium]RUV53442.1 cytochrome c oxidase subunit I [Mesorhizobium sp. M7A.F.Ca.MR.228.00.0.0]RWD14305.1 MAG: cytochrome c oxidase subunit I [Mesorhizobium sp.]RUU94012.1 cytochrome c oxidase subunit I [Mesorhizobium sp. M7A.F.Ca.MR.176.00.0.0]RUV22662.1 cytochrome c oxidase subunit I [Mesorhizobium sp. M7A.F.Ca.MR.245.00.0.0]RVD16641.1 cytochrome c oxidase subunit I [Mesorhizobium sp. M7A.F.Ca.ET.027.02.1.1]
MTTLKARIKRNALPSAEKIEEEQLRLVWKTPIGWRYWTSVNNTQVGLWYGGAAFAFMLFGGVLALLVRTQLAVPGNNFLSADFYNQAFTLHGTVMMFLFAVPIFEAVAIFLLPPMLGARELPFPRLGAFGFWSFLIGGVFVCGSIFFDAAPSSGWFMYPPLATDKAYSGIGADIWLLGLSFIEVASIAAAVELIVGIMKCRAPGMRINLMPLFAWYLLIVAGMILFAFPPLIAGDILFEMQRMFDWPFFDPTRGGDPLLWQHLFWIFGHPEVYIIFLPAIALMAMIVPTFSQRPIVGYSWIVLAAVGTGFLSFGLWVHHMFATGLPQISLAFFSAASEAVAIPTGVQIFVFIATMLAGRVIFSVPMLFGAGGLAIFVIGGLTGVMVALVPFDWQAHDTYFIVAHLHYVLIGGMLFPLVAGVYYYYPLINARMLSPRLGRTAFWLMFAGFNVAFFPMHLSGLRGMPRRVFTYPEGIGWDWLNLISTIGAYVFAAGVLVVVFDVVRPKHREPRSEQNPWKAGTLEWLNEPEENWGVRSIPIIESRYPLWDQADLMQKVNEGAYYLRSAKENRRETLITSVLDAHPLQCQRVATSTTITIISAALLGGVFVALTFELWILALLSGIGTLSAVLWWLWTGTGETPEKKTKDVGLGLRLPLYASGPDSVGWWAMFITMVGDGTAFASLIFGYFFYWTIHPDFTLGQPGPGMRWPMIALSLFVAAWVAMLGARRLNASGWIDGARVALVAAFLLTLAASAAGFAGPWQHDMQPTAHVYPAIVWILVIWALAHAAVGSVMQLYCLARSLAGRLTREHDMELHNVALYWHFMAITAVITFAVIGLFPEAM